MSPFSVDHKDFDNRIRLQTYFYFVEKGTAPTSRQLADTLFSTPAGIKESFQRLADAHIFVLKPESGEIWMAMPFSAIKTQHRVSVGGRKYFANCAWDSLGIPSLRCPHAPRGSDALIHSRCEDCGEPIELEVKNGQVQGSGEVIHFAVPASKWWNDISFACATMLFFRSEEHVDNWCRKKKIDKGAVFTLEQGWQLAQQWYHDRLDLRWRRKTTDEAQQLFETIGLTGDFWKLAAQPVSE